MPSGLNSFLDNIKGELLSQGFQKKGNSFHRQTPHFWQVLNWQQSTDKTAGHIRFTVNVGINDLRLQELMGAPASSKPDIWETQYRIRLGELLPERKDKWWSLATDGSDESSRVAEFKKMLATVVFPFFESMSASDSLLTLWKSGASPGQTSFMREKFLSALGERG